MTPTELADELESIAPHLHTLGVAEACAIEAAQTLRALEAVRLAAVEYRLASGAYEEIVTGCGERLHEAEVALDAALARAGGGK